MGFVSLRGPQTVFFLAQIKPQPVCDVKLSLRGARTLFFHAQAKPQPGLMRKIIFPGSALGSPPRAARKNSPTDRFLNRDL